MAAWSAAAWFATAWVEGAWAFGDAPIPPPIEASGGGGYPIWAEADIARRKKKRKEQIEEAEEALDTIEAALEAPQDQPNPAELLRVARTKEALLEEWRAEALIASLNTAKSAKAASLAAEFAATAEALQLAADEDDIEVLLLLG